MGFLEKKMHPVDKSSLSILFQARSGVLQASSTFYASAKDQSPVDAKLVYYGRVREI